MTVSPNTLYAFTQHAVAACALHEDLRMSAENQVLKDQANLHIDDVVYRYFTRNQLSPIVGPTYAGIEHNDY
jgi:hypothetical protein